MSGATHRSPRRRDGLSHDRPSKPMAGAERTALGQECPTCGRWTGRSEEWSTGQCDECFLDTDEPQK